MAARRLSHRGATGDEPVLVPARFSLRHTAREAPANAQIDGDAQAQALQVSICGAEVPDLPMPVLNHQMSHVRRRPFARDRREPDQHDHERPAPPTPAPDLEQS